MSTIQLHFLKAGSHEIEAAADEYSITVSRGDGLPMSEAEVDATLTMYMRDKQKAAASQARMNPTGRRKDEKLVRPHHDAGLTDPGTRAKTIGRGASASLTEVINTSVDNVDVLSKLSKKSVEAWHLALKQLKAGPGPQVVTIDDLVAAERLAEAGLVRPRIYRGQAVSGQFVIPRTKAFCSLEQQAPCDEGMFRAPLRAK